MQRGFAGMPRALGDGFAVANARWRGIVEYSAVTAVVGVIVILLRAITLLPRTGAEGAGLVSLIYLVLLITWSIITCLVAPIMAAENISGIDAIRRSRELLRFTWGRLISGWVWLGLGLFLAIVVVVVISLILSFIAMATAGTAAAEAIFTILYFITIAALALIYNTIGNIFAAALYQDAFARVPAAPSQPMLAPSLSAPITQVGNMLEGRGAALPASFPVQRGANMAVHRPIQSHRTRPKRG